jgi:hypothetical protein
VVLGGLTLVASAWLYAALRVGDVGWAPPASRAPWGPIVVVFPEYGSGSVYPKVMTGLVLLAVVVLVANEWRQHRALQGMARRGFLPQR